LAIVLLLIIFFLKSRLPVEVLESLPVPGLDSIDFHHIKSYSTETSEQHPDLDVKSSLLPFFTYLEHASTNFVYVSIIFFYYVILLKIKSKIFLFLLFTKILRHCIFIFDNDISIIEYDS